MKALHGNTSVLSRNHVVDYLTEDKHGAFVLPLSACLKGQRHRR